jgi:HEAT repeat protein
MVNFRKKLCYQAVFIFLIICSPGLGPLTPTSYASDYDQIVAALRQDDWQSRLLEPGAMDFNDEDTFDVFASLINNTGLDWRIRDRGIFVLGKSGNPRTGDFLRETFYNAFITDECPAIKSSLALALGNFRDDGRVVDVLLSGMNDDELQVREASIRALGMIGSTKAVPFLIERLRDPNFTVRLSAIRSLAMIGDRKAVPFLKDVIDKDGDAFIKNEASAALHKMQYN